MRTATLVLTQILITPKDLLQLELILYHFRVTNIIFLFCILLFLIQDLSLVGLRWTENTPMYRKQFNKLNGNNYHKLN